MNHRLVEFTSRLPIALKLRGLQTKRVLRQAMAGVVPAGIAPAHEARSDGAAGSVAGRPAARTSPPTRSDGSIDRLVRERAVQDLFADHVARRRDNRRELWALIMLQLWTESSATRAVHREGDPRA